MKTDIITRLETLIKENCTTIDREAAFAESLDSEGTVNVAGMEFYPSRIWQELDPTAFRTGVNDYADGMDWREVGGEYYEGVECDVMRDNLISELESEVEDLEDSKNEEEGDLDPNLAIIEELQGKIDALNADIATLNKHSF